ncbi:hypothetical protein J2Y73_004064 [Peribacillus frigoritolerans]|uniref:Uncharacterized protein n=1 Tax=Peribacillus simplex TaxID=1478 RepID=A0AAN2PJK8_9BACI|nr:hypothetical protein [Peribacillus frigoritolerans]MDP9740029.1 hypothetical protein [Bacillus sp. B2I3]TWE04232.1 hypothetical protein FB545_1325 [Peribacillus frigoritolerans]CEG33767.1 hypothetical protein BN1180_03947 [Peribacillus simplex]
MTLYLHGVVAISRSVSNDNHITFDLCQAEYF